MAQTAHPLMPSHDAITPCPTIDGHAAEIVRPVLVELLGPRIALRFEFWDGSAVSPPETVATVRISSPDAIRRLLWMPNEVGFCRAYVAGDLDIDGDIFDVVTALRDAKPAKPVSAMKVRPAPAAAARRRGARRRPLPPPAEEARLAGRRHSLRRDSKAVSHHYDVGNAFYRLVLGPTMTYSCARFTDTDSTLEQAQEAKNEMVCRKLGLHEVAGARLLDVGCGWGSLAIHAAVEHGARVVGVTISSAQAELARTRVAEAGVADLVDIRHRDYREVKGETFDAISSIGMSEHVGQAHIDEYFATLRSMLGPHGRLLNHAISSVGGSKLGRTSFVSRYVFPDGELVDVGEVVLAMERAGFEVRDVESLREHYARTLRAWVANLEANWDEAAAAASEARAKIWRLYMAGSAIGFEDGGIGIHQVLGVIADSTGGAAMPLTRRGWH